MSAAEITNEVRAARAGFALVAYDLFGAQFLGDTEATAPQDALADIIGDLWHLADHFGLDMWAALRAGDNNHLAEVQAEESDDIVVVILD